MRTIIKYKSKQVLSDQYCNSNFELDLVPLSNFFVDCAKNEI